MCAHWNAQILCNWFDDLPKTQTDKQTNGQINGTNVISIHMRCAQEREWDSENTSIGFGQMAIYTIFILRLTVFKYHLGIYVIHHLCGWTNFRWGNDYKAKQNTHRHTSAKQIVRIDFVRGSTHLRFFLICPFRFVERERENDIRKYYYGLIVRTSTYKYMYTACS